MDQNEKIKRDKKGLLVLLLLLIAVISGTFAVTFSRYYSSTTGKAEASVAKWSVEITDKDMIQQKMEETATIICTRIRMYTNCCSNKQVRSGS